MKDYASFLMVSALCVAACATETAPTSNVGAPNTAAGSAAPAGPAGSAAGAGAAQPSMSASSAGSKASGGAGAPAATSTTPQAGTGAAAAAGSSAAAAGGGSAGRSGGTSATTAPMGSFKAAYDLALRDMCMGCHTPDALIGSPTLSTLDKAYETLVDKDATTAMPGQCAGMGKLVTPGNCETSLLYNKIAEDKPKCGRHMPLGSDTMPTRLPAEALEAVCAWIKAGAKKD